MQLDKIASRQLDEIRKICYSLSVINTKIDLLC